MKLVRAFIAFVVVSLFVGIGSAFNGQSYSEDNLNDFHKSVDKIEIGNDISTEIVDKETVNEEQLQPADNNNSFSESNEKTTSKKQQSVKKNETKTTNTNNSNSNSNVNPSENTTQIQENEQKSNESTQPVETKETTNISISSNDDYRINKDEWLKTENHHKAIVKKEIFLQVNKMIFDRGLRTSNDGKYYKYSGFLKCGDCKNNMYRTNKRYKKADTVYYYCGNYQNNRTCSSHCIKEIEIDEVVLQSINKFISLVCDLEERLKNELSISTIEYNNEIKDIKLLKLNKEIDKYKKMLEEIKDDYKNELISEEDFDNFNDYYLYEINKLNIAKEDIENNKVNNSAINWITRTAKIGYIDEINRNIVKEFINNIYIYEDKRIEIDFKFGSQYEEAIMYLKNRDNMV